VPGLGGSARLGLISPVIAQRDGLASAKSVRRASGSSASERARRTSIAFPPLTSRTSHPGSSIIQGVGCAVSAGRASHLHAVNEHENVALLIPLNLANRCFVTMVPPRIFGFSDTRV
jgi:hypothetical protein